MKVAIYNNNVSRSVAVAKQIRSLLKQKSAGQITFDADYPDIVLSIGGDGTLLSAFHHYRKQLASIRFIGIHTGHLGFYADWQHTEIPALVESLLADNGEEVDYPLLAGRIHFRDGREKRVLALNEAVIKRQLGTLSAAVYINGQLFERFRGDGLVMSTPTGSTAYNKSVGGAVVHPTLETMQMAEIASINNRVFRTLGSPIVLSKADTVRVVNDSRARDVSFHYDNLNILSHDIAWMEFKVAPQKIQFAQYRHMNFWKRIEMSFIGPEGN